MVFLFAALVLACGSGSSSSSSSSSSPAKDPSKDQGDPSIPITFHGIEGTPGTDVPLVATKGGVISLDGAKVADVPAVPVVSVKEKTPKKATEKPARIDGLFQALHARADKWKKAHPTEASPGRVAFTFDRDEQASVVKSVIVTAAYAGYPNGALLVRVPAKTGGELVASYLNVDVNLRVAGEPPPKEIERELHMALSSHGVVLLKWQEGNKALGDVFPSGLPVAKLATDIGHGWNDRGLHHEPTDKRFDQAILHVDNDTPYALIVVALDAVHATKRKLAVAGNEELVPAINVSLAVD
jgi:hypothetical protein